MWIADLKLLLSFCVCSVLAYSSNSNYQRQWAWRTTTKGPPVKNENDIDYGNLKLRHHSHFPNLDRVMMKIENMQQKLPAAKLPSLERNSGIKLRHQGWNPAARFYKTTTTTTTTTTPSDGLFGEVYEDYEEDEHNNDYDEWDDDITDEDYEEDTEDSDDLLADNSFQAEEATEPTTPVTAPVSSLTKFKWDNYGTRSRVEESRRQIMFQQQQQQPQQTNTELRDTSEAIQHYKKIKREGQCRRPQPKVIPVQNDHPNPSKVYTPHCTILHRCAEDTGCCTRFDTKCGPKTIVPVHLYVYTKTLGVVQTKVEKLLFYNHTECACLEKKKASNGSAETSLTRPVLSLRSAGQVQSDDFQQKCTCPEEFSARFRYDTGCSCDCEEHNRDCLGMKKGEEFFSLTDRMCINAKDCGIPMCEYGLYLHHIGRCPRKHDKIETHHNRRSTLK